MNRFYFALVNDWLDKPAVCLAFGVRWNLDTLYTAANRRTNVVANICSLHSVQRFNEIDPQVLLKTLHTKGILQTLPDELDRFKKPELTQQGPYGKHYKSLHPGWFNAPKVLSAFGLQRENPKDRERKIKRELYWELGVVSLSQVHPKDFCDLIMDLGIGFTLPSAVVQAARGEL